MKENEREKESELFEKKKVRIILRAVFLIAKTLIYQLERKAIVSHLFTLRRTLVRNAHTILNLQNPNRFVAYLISCRPLSTRRRVQPETKISKFD